jgi:hypothetical protein
VDGYHWLPGHSLFFHVCHSSVAANWAAVCIVQLGRAIVSPPPSIEACQLGYLPSCFSTLRVAVVAPGPRALLSGMPACGPRWGANKYQTALGCSLEVEVRGVFSGEPSFGGRVATPTAVLQMLAAKGTEDRGDLCGRSRSFGRWDDPAFIRRKQSPRGVGGMPECRQDGTI